jgi:hypothetical protein
MISPRVAETHDGDHLLATASTFIAVRAPSQTAPLAADPIGEFDQFRVLAGSGINLRREHKA